MKPMPLTVFVGTLALGGWSFAIPDAGAEPVLIAPTLEAGKRYEMTQVQSGVTKMSMGELTMDQKMSLEMGMAFEVEAVADDKRKVSVSFPTLKGNLSMMEQEMAFDAADAAGSHPMLSGLVKGVQGLRYIFEVAPDETITDVKVEGGDALAQNPMGAGLGIDEGTLKVILASLLGEGFPDKPVEAGESWTHEQTIPFPQIGDLTIATEYTYEGPGTVPGSETTLPKVNFKGGLVTPADGEADDDADGDVEKEPSIISFKAFDITGSSYYDVDKRIFTHSDSDIEGVIEMNNGETTLELPTTQKATLTLDSISELKKE